MNCYACVGKGEMMKENPFEKIIHRGDKCNDKGQVSALCFERPRPINLSKSSWTNRDEAVTCAKCLRKLKENEK